MTISFYIAFNLFVIALSLIVQTGRRNEPSKRLAWQSFHSRGSIAPRIGLFARVFARFLRRSCVSVSRPSKTNEGKISRCRGVTYQSSRMRQEKRRRPVCERVRVCVPARARVCACERKERKGRSEQPPMKITAVLFLASYCSVFVPSHGRFRMFSPAFRLPSRREQRQ